MGSMHLQYSDWIVLLYESVAALLMLLTWKTQQFLNPISPGNFFRGAPNPIPLAQRKSEELLDLKILEAFY